MFALISNLIADFPDNVILTISLAWAQARRAPCCHGLRAIVLGTSVALLLRGERSGSALEQVVVKPSPTFSFSGLLFSRRVFEIWKGGENVTRRGWADGELALAASRTSHPHTPHTLPLLHNPQGERMHPPSTSLSTSPRVGNRAASRPAVCARAGDYRNSRI